MVVAGDATGMSCVNEEPCLVMSVLYNSLFRNLAEGFTSGTPEYSGMADSEGDSAADSETSPTFHSFTPVQ